MEKYFINEVLEMDCDDNGNLTVKFVLEEDDENTFRLLETNEYYYWVDENYNDEISGEPLTNDWDEEEHYSDEGFNFIQWKDYNHSEEVVIEFIKDSFLSKEELPIKIKIEEIVAIIILPFQIAFAISIKSISSEFSLILL